MRRAGEFEELRPLLFSIAYRILGSVSEAEDAVQETWLRYAASPAQPASARAFLSAVATRISINVLRSARYRREEYVGPWLPGPLIEDPCQDPQRSAELADSVSMAALLLLERLSPPFWKAPGPELLEPALHTAAGLDDPGIAVMLLRPFAVEWVTPAHAGGLAALAARYGESWHRDLLDAWFGSRNTWRYTGDVDRKGWAGALPELTAALRDAGAAATAGWLLAASWGWLGDDIRLWLRYPSPATRRKQLAELGKPLAGLLAAADGTALAGEIAAVLREHGDDVLACLPAADAAGGRARTRRAP